MKTAVRARKVSALLVFVLLASTSAIEVGAPLPTNSKNGQKQTAPPTTTKCEREVNTFTKHTTVKDDTLSKIAAKYKVASWRDVWKANPTIQNPDLIYPGQVIIVPQKKVVGCDDDTVQLTPPVRDPVRERQINQTTQDLLTCLQRKGTSAGKTVIRPALLKYRDEYIQTIPGATIWLTEGLRRLLTTSAEETREIATMFVDYKRRTDRRVDDSSLSSPSGLAELLSRQFCFANDPCTRDERCLIMHLTLLAVIGSDARNSNPTVDGEQLFPNAKEFGDKIGCADKCNATKPAYASIKGVPRMPPPVPLKSELDSKAPLPPAPQWTPLPVQVQTPKPFKQEAKKKEASSNSIGSLLKKGTDLINKHAQNLVGKAKGLIDKGKALVTKGINHVKNLAGKAKDFVGQKINDVVNKGKSLVKNVFGGLFG